jgi:P-type Ca2+ transporter type 2C
MQSDPPPTTQHLWHSLGIDGVARALATDPTKGLSEPEAETRLLRAGRNELVSRGGRGITAIALEQLTATMTLILLGAVAMKAVIALVSGTDREWLDAAAIAAIVLLNVSLGVLQEFRAERAIAALGRMAAPSVRVRRTGTVQQLDARQLVPGDVIEVETGSIVPADARLVAASNLQTLESALTGESTQVGKHTGPLPAGTALAERTNMLFFGTSVVAGRGMAVVVETGMRTEIGRVADLLQHVESAPTPLQRRLSAFGATLAVIVGCITAGMVGLGVWRGTPLTELLATSVALAVGAIPEGLPAVLTVSLALGAQRLLAQRALVRRLPSVETLGSITTICTDKTGTLTENRMQVVVVDVAGHEIDRSERLRHGSPIADAAEHAYIPADGRDLLALSALCNDAVLPRQTATTIGDPTEGALLVCAAEHGLWKDDLDSQFPRIGELPFTSDRKRMTTVHDVSGRRSPGNEFSWAASPRLAAVKGSADGLLPLSSQVLEHGRIKPMSEEYRARIRTAMNRLAARGLRVLGVACRAVEESRHIDETLEHDLIFVGLVGLLDPPRPEAREAVARCLAAGIRPVMITGDHPLTALEIARQLGIAGPGDVAITGDELERLSPDDLARTAGRAAVFARVSPEHKLRIVEALQREGQIVAMTGDGVNDAPALRRADIGVAMGITGTDVSKEAADIVITDDNFATIVRAIEQGRAIFDNVRKFVKYIVTSNSAEVSVMVLSQLAGMPMPLTTIQILWMNLVTDGVPGLALALEPSEPDTMRRPPFDPNESLFSRGIGRHALTIGVLMAALAFGVGYWGWISNRPAWGTMVFVTLTLAQLGHALSARSNLDSAFRLGLRTNPLMIAALATTFALQLLVVYVPVSQRLFGLVRPSPAELLICLVASTTIFFASEKEKALRRRAEQRTPRAAPPIAPTA